MKHYCTVPMEIKKSEDGTPYYVYCNDVATHAVKHSLWYVCEAHANTMKAEGRWEVVPIEEVEDAKENTCGCGGIRELAESERQACGCSGEGGCGC